jgi:hypothetical protein
MASALVVRVVVRVVLLGMEDVFRVVVFLLRKQDVDSGSCSLIVAPFTG